MTDPGSPNVHVDLALPADLAEALDAFIRDQPENSSHPEAIRRVLKGALTSLGYLDRIPQEGMRPEDLSSDNDG